MVAVSSVVDEAPSSLLLQEKTVRLKRDMRIMYKTLFIFSSIPKVKYYLYILVRLINNTNRFVLQEIWDFTWRVSDCEELVGQSQEMMGWF